MKVISISSSHNLSEQDRKERKAFFSTSRTHQELVIFSINSALMHCVVELDSSELLEFDFKIKHLGSHVNVGFMPVISLADKLSDEQIHELRESILLQDENRSQLDAALIENARELQVLSILFEKARKKVRKAA